MTEAGSEPILPSPILVVVRDLMFSGRILAEARAAGAQIKSIRDPADIAKLTDTNARLMIADLNLPGAIAAAADWRKTGDRKVIGFVSHVDSQTIAEAKTAGIDQVLARSRFVQILPELLRAG
jgi:DNA-binding NarL/FixJ family response regulator